MLAGAMSGVTLSVASMTGFLEGGDIGIFISVYIFVSQIAYQGARSGRKTHLTDMDTDDRKSV